MGESHAVFVNPSLPIRETRSSESNSLEPEWPEASRSREWRYSSAPGSDRACQHVPGHLRANAVGIDVSVEPDPMESSSVVIRQAGDIDTGSIRGLVSFEYIWRPRRLRWHLLVITHSFITSSLYSWCCWQGFPGKRCKRELQKPLQVKQRLQVARGQITTCHCRWRVRSPAPPSGAALGSLRCGVAHQSGDSTPSGGCFLLDGFEHCFGTLLQLVDCCACYRPNINGVTNGAGDGQFLKLRNHAR